MFILSLRERDTELVIQQNGQQGDADACRIIEEV